MAGQQVSGDPTGSAFPANAFGMGIKNGANLSALTAGQSTMANSIPVTIASDNTGTVGTASAVVNVGQQTSNTSAVQISSTSTIPTNGIIIEALSTNSAPIYVGGSGVTISNGYQLSPGQAISFTCNLNTLYVIGSNSIDKICWNVA